MIEPRVLVTGGSGFIGKHLIKKLSSTKNRLLNIDLIQPSLRSQNQYWKQCDIKDLAKLAFFFKEFQPTHVIHLAAKANLKGDSIEDFPDNVIGTSNVVDCVNQMDHPVRLAHTSTQYVVTPGTFPKTDDFLQPYTAYGESKAEAERIVRLNCSKCYIILRPTNIWGPMHANFPNEMWPYLEKRYYFHPGFSPITKYYGYIDNSIAQILKLSIDCDGQDVCGKVFYITDLPIDSSDWLNGFSIALSGKPIRRIPRSIWYLLSRIGDLAIISGIKVPISSDRYFRLTVNESLPIENTITLTGIPKVSLKEGVLASTEWFTGSEAQQG